MDVNMKPKAKSFPIVGGYCRIFTDRIEIVEEGWKGKWHNWLFQKGMGRKSAGLILLALGSLVAAGISYLIDNTFLAAFFGTFTIIIFIRAWVERKVSYNPVIQRKHITEVKFISAIPGVQRASIDFKWMVNNKLRKRELKLPLDNNGGGMVVQSTLHMLKDEGLVQ